MATALILTLAALVIAYVVRRYVLRPDPEVRYGVRYANGTKEITGIPARASAEEAARFLGGVWFHYKPLDLRVNPWVPTRPRVVGIEERK